VDRRVVVAGVGVVAQALAPGGDDGPEGGAGGILLELGLDAGGQVVEHDPQALRHVAGLGQAPFAPGVALAHLGEGVEEVGISGPALDHHPCLA
jgi:hypothetical protein